MGQPDRYSANYKTKNPKLRDNRNLAPQPYLEIDYLKIVIISIKLKVQQGFYK